MNQTNIEQYLNQHYDHVESITLGWSHDLKYCVWCESDSKKYFIRINPINNQDSEKYRFDQMHTLYLKGLPIQKPISFETVDDFIVQTFEWIEGEVLEFILSSLDASTQRKLGEEAGKILKRIHEIPSQYPMDWMAHIQRKFERKRLAYMKCGIKVNHESEYLSVLEKKLDIKNRETTFQHGDYHVGNMLYANGKLIIIDFNRSDDGDPWQDFDRIAFSTRISPEFAMGQIQGYFNHDVPDDFFTTLRYYFSLNTFGSIAWAIPYGEQEVEVMQEIASLIHSSYKNSDIPTWYKV
jgi:aminoglycoside phosphotransferase (APT) family kinase protein